MDLARWLAGRGGPSAKSSIGQAIRFCCHASCSFTYDTGASQAGDLLNRRVSNTLGGVMAATESDCDRLRQLLQQAAKDGFGQDFNALVAGREQELWIMGIDSKNRTLVDLCGNIGTDLMTAINAKGFFDSDAGMRANAQALLPLGERKADIFILNCNHLNAPDWKLIPLIVHELAHFFDQIGIAPAPTIADISNANLIRASFDQVVLNLHPDRWAHHLACAARRMVTDRKCIQTSVGHYFELCIPSGDRPHWQRSRVIEPIVSP